MFASGRGIIEKSVRAISRPLTFSGFDDPSIHSWLLGNPDVPLPFHLPNGRIPALLTNRINSHIAFSVGWSIPGQQQIDFETPPQILGIEGLLVSASIIFNLAFRIRELSRRNLHNSKPRPSTQAIYGWLRWEVLPTRRREDVSPYRRAAPPPYRRPGSRADAERRLRGGVHPPHASRSFLGETNVGPAKGTL